MQNLQKIINYYVDQLDNIPTTDLYDKLDYKLIDDIYTLSIEMPGVAKEDLDIKIESLSNYYLLKINGFRKNLNDKEISYNQVVKLTFKPENVDALLENGLLLIKIKQSEKQEIKVNIL